MGYRLEEAVFWLYTGLLVICMATGLLNLKG